MKGFYYTFIIRIHSESRGKFRGSVQHIRTQEEAHFDSFEDLKAFIEKRIGVSANSAPPDDSRFA